MTAKRAVAGAAASAVVPTRTGGAPIATPPSANIRVLPLHTHTQDFDFEIRTAVETVNPDTHATLDAPALCKMADHGQITGAAVDGPLAFDNAVSATAARTKGIVSKVAGSPDILVVPDLESGNMLAKQLEYLGGAASAGIAVGARVPIVLTSRADSRESRIASCAIGIVAARQGGRRDALAARPFAETAVAATRA